MIELARRFFGPYRTQLILGPLSKMLEVAFDLAVPLVVAWMVDGGILGRDTGVIWRGGAALLAMALLGFGSTLVCQSMAARCCCGVAADIRRSLFSHVMAMAPSDVADLGTPTLITRTTNDVNQVQLAVSMLIRQVIRWPFLALGSLGCALAIDWHMGLVFCVAMPLIATVFYVVMSRSVPYFASMQRALDRVALVCRETLGGIRPIRAFGQWGRQRARFEEAAAHQAAIATASSRLTSILDPATFLVMNLGICAVLVIGANQVAGGILAPGQVMAFIGYMTQLLVSIVFVANLVVIFTRAQASATRIMEVLGQPITISQPEGDDVALDPKAPVLDLANVSLTYEGAQRSALAAIDLSLGAGEVLGVIGGTGSGKSSLARIATRLLAPTTGTVSLMGRDMACLPEAELRRLVSVVPQRSQLLAGTIRSNLTWRDPQATDEDLAHALATAQADFVWDLEGGLDHEVEQGGANLSGGQRQRLCIARAIVASPLLLVMDDATSALDYETDRRLRGALAAMEDAPARMIIAQRVASVRHADRILVLDHGTPVGLGTHEELSRGCVLYQEICRSQHWEEREGGAM